MTLAVFYYLIHHVTGHDLGSKTGPQAYPRHSYSFGDVRIREGLAKTAAVQRAMPLTGLIFLAKRGNYPMYGASSSPPRHKAFVSYHHANSQVYCDKFEQLLTDRYDIIFSKSVQIGDIPDSLKMETIRQKIRDEYLRDSTVPVVLLGPQTG